MGFQLLSASFSSCFFVISGISCYFVPQILNQIEFYENGKTSEFFMDDEHGIILLDENVIKDSVITDEHINCMFIKG